MGRKEGKKAGGRKKPGEQIIKQKKHSPDVNFNGILEIFLY